MKHFNRTIAILIVAIGLASMVCGCEMSTSTVDNSSSKSVPFSDVDWTDKLDNIISLYGDYSEKYDSSYGGPCYVYEETVYESLKGNTRYFFDSNNSLVCIEFCAKFNTSEELELAYNEEKQRLTNTYGNSGYKIEESGIVGENWYRDSGNIGLLAVYALSRNELQIKYLNSSISTDGPNADNEKADVNEESIYLEKYVELIDYEVEECVGYQGRVPGLHGVSIRNNGNMEITNIQINLQFLSSLGEVIDSEEVTVFGVSDGTIKPGYSWKMEDDIFYELDNLNDSVELSRVKATISHIDLRESEPKPQKTDEDLYIEEHIVLLDYKVGMCNSYHGEVPGLSAVSLKNNGERDIDEVTITVYFQDLSNKNIAEASFVVIGNLWSADKLKANYSWAMEKNKFFEITNLSDEVDISRYTVEVSHIEFSK